MARKKHYYSNNQTNWKDVAPNEIQTLNLDKPFKFSDEKADAVFEDWSTKFEDDWHNNIASINANNSLTQFNTFLTNRLSYAECSHLATDTIIHNAITKFTNECMRSGGAIEINEEIDNADDIIQSIEKRMKELKVEEIVKKAIQVSLEYGDSKIYIDVNSNDLTKPLIKKKETLSSNRIQGFKVVAPYSSGAVRVETANVLDKDYMIPSQWYVQGAGVVDNSRFMQLVIFKCPELIRPLYNFGGIALSQFMKNYVSTADGTRQALADIMLRFRTKIIKSDLAKVNPIQAKERAESINRQQNNLGVLLLTKSEEYQETITTISGLERISAHQMEYVSVAARIPATELFGITPSGLNATGAEEQKSYHNTMNAIQVSDLKPIYEEILRLICLEMGLDLHPEYVFNELDTKSEVDVATLDKTYSDVAVQNITAGLWTHEQGIEYMKTKEVLNDSFEYDEEAMDNIDNSDDTDFGY